MKRIILFISCFFFISLLLQAESLYPVRGICLKAPTVNSVDEFVSFVDNELALAEVNLIVLRIDYNYKFKTRPELTGDNPLDEEDVKKIVKVCQKNNIRIIPLINLLGHQSASEKIGKLLEVYPEFDETPNIELPEKYVWPNPDELYCKSYCPLHPEVHNVVFDLVDEIIDVFETDAFHAGMDEVFYIGHSQCTRCYGRDKAELFAGEVTKIFNHLQETDKELWIWGDRLLDGVTTGLGIWEGSYNNTHRAIDMIPKNVVICDWHYERSDPTAAYFASKGFRVLSCPWRKSNVAIEQVKMLNSFIENSTNKMGAKYIGMLQTVWSPTETFMQYYQGLDRIEDERTEQTVQCFKRLVGIWNQ